MHPRVLDHSFDLCSDVVLLLGDQSPITKSDLRPTELKLGSKTVPTYPAVQARKFGDVPRNGVLVPDFGPDEVRAHTCHRWCGACDHSGSA